MHFVDTHTHLYMSDYGDGCDDAVRRAIDAGVTKMILPDVDSSVRESVFSMASRFPGSAFPCLGLHPTEIPENWKEEVDRMMEYRDRKGIVAIGETGMDFHWARDNAAIQEEVFRIQLDLALEMDIPVIVHNREATEHTLNILKDYRGRGLRGVFHAYGGSIETFMELQRLGDWYVGIGGVLTYKNASIASTLKEIPLDRILLETDSPYLPPVPYRGTRNESSHIPVIAAKVAEIKGTGIEEVAERTTGNAVRLFGLPEPCGQRRETL